MAAGGKNKSDQEFLQNEDILISILLRLPIALYIARLRCVCRSWRNLLSDVNFIREILFFQNLADQKDLQVLITGMIEEPGSLRSGTIPYSLRSYETLSPIEGEFSKLPFIERPILRFNFVACCDGIFCMISFPNVVLWNPTTSETKFLPPCPHHPRRIGYGGFSFDEEFGGFGYDPVTDDYKVVWMLHCEKRYERGDYGPLPVLHTEVYSLRNDSWKRVDLNCEMSSGIQGCGIHPNYVHQGRHTSRNEKCYWYYDKVPKLCGILSFDVSTEVFEHVSFPYPPALRNHDVETRAGNRRIRKHNCWSSVSCFMLKESFIVTFGPTDYKNEVDPYEIWGLLRHGFEESWIKLFTFQPPGRSFVNYLDIWKDTTLLCSHGMYRLTTDDPAAKEVDGVFCLDLSTGEIVRNHLEIQSTVQPFLAHIFTPTRVSLFELSSPHQH